MPVNAPAEYFKAEEKFREARTREEKIRALEEMIRLLPKHKGSEKLLAALKTKLSRLRNQRERAAKRKGWIKKEGDVMVCILGLPNSGKSRLLNALTGAGVEVSEVPYTTSEPAVGVADYGGVKIQLVEIPAAFRREHMGLVRNSDAVLLVVNSERDRAELENVLKSFGIELPVCEARADEEPEAVKERIWRVLGLIRVYTRVGKKVENRPIVLKEGSTVRDAVSEIHRDMLKTFRFARIWPGKYPGEKVGLNYKLKDGDIIEVFA